MELVKDKCTECGGESEFYFVKDDKVLCVYCKFGMPRPEIEKVISFKIRENTH